MAWWNPFMKKKIKIPASRIFLDGKIPTWKTIVKPKKNKRRKKR
jgi:hypothetical protein